MSWRQYNETEARNLTEAQIAWRKKKFIDQLTDEQLVEKVLVENLVLLHATECPKMDEYSEFVWVPRTKEME